MARLRAANENKIQHAQSMPANTNGITGPSSYVPVMTAFNASWEEANSLLPSPYIVRLADVNQTMTRAQFEALITTLEAQQNTVTNRLVQQQVARGQINQQKTALLAQFALFVSVLDGYYQNTEFDTLRPICPSFHDGKEVFCEPLGLMLNLWEEINEGPAPAGITLPLTLSDGTSKESFASAISTLAFAYKNEEKKAFQVDIARARRNRTQMKAYEAMKFYREGARNAFRAFPELLDTLPRLTPLPGHTPTPVAASAVFQPPNATKVVHEASTDPDLHSYQLRGTAGDQYDESDAVVIATHSPTDPREFITTFGLTQPGVKIALKVFVILNTDNEAGSAPMIVERPAEAVA